ncbi:hypothetical protein MKY51_07245 [Solibacillus sp. FSL R5-0691]|uniref:hypothetical protein n=1 Tax=Solibacillus sp. FSL R5-0691 TaxID=2921653 RepID=UPI0030D033B9
MIWLVPNIKKRLGHNPKMISIPGRFPRAWPEPVVSGVTLFPQEALLVAKGVAVSYTRPAFQSILQNIRFLIKAFLLFIGYSTYVPASKPVMLFYLSINRTFVNVR